MPDHKRYTIRLSPSAQCLVQDEAERDGISVPQFIRESAVFRAVYHRAKRGDDIHLAVREAWKALFTDDVIVASHAELAVDSVKAHAPAVLNDLLRVLEAKDPSGARIVRGLYDLADHEYLPEEPGT